MKDGTMALMKDAQLAENRRVWLEKLRTLFDGPYTGPIVLNGCVGRHAGSLACGDLRDIYCDDPQRALEIGLEDLAGQIEQARAKTGDMFLPFCMEADWYGVHLVDKIFGAHVFYDEEAKQWYNRYLDTPVGKLKAPDMERSTPWRQVRSYAEAFLALDTEVPLLGTAVLSSPLNIAVNLYGADFLVAMLEEPEAARRDLAVIYDVIAHMHRWYLGHVPMERLQPTVAPWRTQPVGFGQICGCSTHLLSPGLYEEFVMPLDDAILGLWPHGGMIHLCGNHRHLIPLFAKMPHLRAVQLNDLAADHLEYYAKGLREDQVIYFSPTAKMPLEKSVQAAHGHRMVYVGDFDPGALNAVTL